MRAGEPVGARDLPEAGPGWLARRAVLPLGLAFGVWVAGFAGAALVGLILLAMWWLGRSAPKHLRHARPGTPTLGGTVLRRLATPWTVAVSLTAAGAAMAAGTYLAMYLPFHDVTEVVGSALRGWIPQLLCLPALARLVLSLGQPGDGLPADADPPSASEEAADPGPGRGGEKDSDGGDDGPDDEGPGSDPEGDGTGGEGPGDGARTPRSDTEEVRT